MASAMISVHTTASRFALLQVDSDSDSDSESGRTKGVRDSGKTRPGKTTGGKSTASNDKKKEKRKKKKEQQQSEANELRNLAFKKLPQKSSAPPPSLSLQGLTSELYEADLEKALMMSKLEFEKHKQDDDGTDIPSPKSRGAGGGKKDKKKNQQGKDKKMTVSLKDFQAEGEDKFFNKLEDDVSKIVQQEKRREQFSNSTGLEVTTSTEHEPDPRTEQLKDDLEKKDQEIDKLKKVLSQWEMLQQGEMKDKAEILLQVEELLNIKEELSSQVTSLHASLEQEKSKVKGLQTDQPKHHPGNRKGKKGPESDL
ncbi:unnamed protein product [Coregonus sp. 'balchen']|nr:unnamed protein product [Coregonus sp. 'balchen']